MRTLLLAVVFVAGLAASPSTALARDANGNHNTHVWVAFEDTVIAPDGGTVTING